jgi:hypothetical protein
MDRRNQVVLTAVNGPGIVPGRERVQLPGDARDAMKGIGTTVVPVDCRSGRPESVFGRLRIDSVGTAALK